MDAGVAAGLSGGAEFTPMFLGAAAAVAGVGVYYHLAAGRGADVDVLAEAEARERDVSVGEAHAKPQAAGGRFESIRGDRREPASVRR